ncbi:hypothetical protein SAMN05216553_11773 [Lentzea fradiae]|uniref:Uncharacterized protein n=1 Tax=Lentzea fradiae TaxID=200378 RepID=A0A1G8AA83_9PSEU|nr:hypothetical protein [Lentzea fradiae]SDH17746.1 hypothetical protein SAMN05216553_11773 [Lentzea fradiae]
MPFGLVKALLGLRPPPPVPEHRPIERIAADLRRVRCARAGFGQGASAAKKIGARQAYDALLSQACAALGVEHRLRVVPEGMDREFERMRVEERLKELGLSF